MDYRHLGRTGLKVSAICLGTMQWGWTATEAEGVVVMDAFVAAGGNFIDTADVYSRWAEGNPGGVSEEIIGRWLKARGNRHEIVLATKVRGRMWEGPNGEGLSRAHIIRAAEESLRRLQTDYIDLYQAHYYDEHTPIDETLRAFDDLVRQGKVRYIGASNYPAWRLMASLWSADTHKTARYDSLQPHYNYVRRAEFERELQAVCQQYGVGVIPYSPLAGGFLTGKYKRGQPVPDSDRAEGVQRRYFNEQGWQALEALQSVANAHQTGVIEVALAWLMAQPTVTAPIVGANSVKQLQPSLDAVSLKLSPDELTLLNKATAWEER